MKENLRVRVGAVVLALATLAAVTYGWLISGNAPSLIWWMTG